MVEIGFLGVFAGIAVAIACFLAYYLVTQLQSKNPALLWLGLAILAVGLRVAKSIVFFIFFGISPIGLALGFFALASIGPLFLTYVKMVTDKAFRLTSSWYLHFLVPVLGAVTCFVITPNHLETTLYQSATALLSGYLIWSLAIHLRKHYTTTEERQWMTQASILMWGAWASFVLQHAAGTIVYYAYGSIVTAGFIFYFFTRVLKQPPVFAKAKKQGVTKEVLEKVRASFEEEHVYHENGMSVNVLASEISVPAYQVTRAVRELYDKTFPEALIHFRVKAFQELITNPDNANLTIEYLAEVAGFKTTSSFYSAFKKETGMTPTAYLHSVRLKTA
ncbi:helix-turn-helix domain-containing protein [Marinoscillum sp.]|uniref:helix-turn-helix domain-containing protein n=1 Tax=Marinoscillum sp. TaxID=2024838 RepID=UPI003BAC3291